MNTRSLICESPAVIAPHTARTIVQPSVYCENS